MIKPIRVLILNTGISLFNFFVISALYFFRHVGNTQNMLFFYVMILSAVSVNIVMIGIMLVVCIKEKQREREEIRRRQRAVRDFYRYQEQFNPESTDT